MSRVENKEAHCECGNQAGSCGRTVKASRAKYPTEDEEQIALAQYLDARFGYYGWIHVPNQRMAKVQYLRKLSKMGVKKGFPDILIFQPCKECVENGYHCSGVALELKRQKYSKVSEDQKKWLTYLELHWRWVQMVAYGAEDAIKKIEEVYGVKK